MPTAVESFSPFNSSFVERRIKPAAAPPTGPPANAAIAVTIPTAKLALPGFAFAQSLTFLTPSTIFESFEPIYQSIKILHRRYQIESDGRYC